jgi:general secretion pathway protein J
MRRDAEHMRRIDAGFTLLEVLAAIAVMAIMLGSASTALNLLSNAAIRGAIQTDQLDMIARGVAAVRNDIAGMRRVTITDKEKRRFLFKGEARMMQFVLIEPSYPSDPGSYLVTYSVRRGGGQTQLVRSREPFDPRRRRRDSEGKDPSEVVVIDGPYRVDFGYLARTVRGFEWAAKWTDDWSMPQLVRLRITPTDANAPAVADLVVHPRVDAEMTCIAGKSPCTTKASRPEAAAEGKQKPSTEPTGLNPKTQPQ